MLSSSSTTTPTQSNGRMERKVETKRDKKKMNDFDLKLHFIL